MDGALFPRCLLLLQELAGKINLHLEAVTRVRVRLDIATAVEQSSPALKNVLFDFLAGFLLFEFEEGNLAIDGLPELLVPVAEAHFRNHGSLFLRLNSFVVLLYHFLVRVHLSDLSFAFLRHLDLVYWFGFEWCLSETKFADVFNNSDST